MITWNDRLKLAVESWRSTQWMGDNMPILRLDRVFKDAGVRDLVKEVEDLTASQEQLLDLLDEVMGHDKGMHEEEWIEFCNRILPLMKEHGRHEHTIGYG